MSPEDRKQLIDAYKAWDPAADISADEMAHKHGVTKSAMYAMLRREGVPLKTGRSSIAQAPAASNDYGYVAFEAVLEQLVQYKIRCRDLEAENDALKAQMREPLKKPGTE